MVCSKRIGFCVAHKSSFPLLVVFIATIVLLISSLSYGMALSFGGGTTAATTLAAATYLTSLPTNIGEPARIAIDSMGFLYVSVPEGGKILKFSPDGSQIDSIGGFQEPFSLAVDSTLNRVYVGDAKDGRVGVVNAEGALLFNLGKGRGEFGIPGDIAVASDGSVYVTDSPNDVVKVYNPDGSFRISFGGTGIYAGQMVFPTGIAVDDSNQEIYVVDHSNARVEVFDFSGSFKRSFSRFGGGSGNLTRPQGIWVSKGRVYVADSFQGSVAVFNANGTFIANIGQFGSDDGKLRIPKDVAICGTKLFVTNAGNRRIEVFTISDTLGLNAEPSGIAFTQGAIVAPASQVIQLTPQVSGAIVPWTATVSAPFTLLLSQTAGTTPSSITVTATAGNLAPGTYFGGIIVRANDTDYPVSVSMTVVPQLSVFPASLSMLYQVGGDLTAKSLAVSSSGTLSWTAATNVPWLALSPASGSTPGSIAVAVNQSVKNLSEGLFPAAVTVSSSGGVGSTSVIPVTLKVARAGTIMVNTNLDSASVTITGPETYTGSGKMWRTDEARPGTYSIQYGQVKGFRKPPSGTFVIKTGQTVVLDGRYRPLVAANVIVAAKGPDPGNDALVQLLDLTGIPIAQFRAFDATHGAQVAMGDIDGDGSGEIVAAPGPGPKNEARISVFRPDGTSLASTAPMAGTKYGAHVAVGDIDGRGKSAIAMSMIDKHSGIDTIVLYLLDDDRTLVEKSRIVVGTDPQSDRGNAGKRIIGNDNPQAEHYPASIAFGDVNRDGSLELIVVTSGRIEVYGFDNALAASLLAAGTLPFEVAKSAYKTQLTVTSGDLDGDDTDEIIVGYEMGQDSFIRAFKGDLTASGFLLKAFEKGKSTPTLSAQDWDGDGLAEILAGQGANPDNDGVLRIYVPHQGDLLREVTAFGGSRYGVVASFGTVKK